MRVLVVDDDGDSRNIYRAALEFSGYEVVEAADGEEALRLAVCRSPDVVLMDMAVPRMDGWATTRALREGVRTAHIPVIGVSAHALPAQIARAREAGCVSYLTKPVEPRLIVEEVARTLGVF
jgi:two-component system, cell cycle response regulator DivK